MTSQGRFITVEGIEGAGKTTAMAFIESQLQALSVDVLVTREPGGTPLAEKIRAVLLEHTDEPMCTDTELLLMFASRAQHLHHKILPALQEGQWVLCDRFTDASYAYQGGGRGVDLSRIAMLEQYVQADLRPDCVILMDLPVTLGFERIQARSPMDRIEQESVSFFNQVRQAYLDRAHAHPAHYHVIDASQPLSGVEEQLRATIQAFHTQHEKTQS